MNRILYKLSLTAAILFLLCTSCLAADTFTSNVADFINTTVLIWTRIIGSLIVIGGVIGWAASRQDQDRMSQMMKIIFGGAAIFGVGEIVGFLFSTFRSEEIIDISQVVINSIVLG
ncbi:MAG: hypothetical protein ABII23_00705 [bacterium]